MIVNLDKNGKIAYKQKFVDKVIDSLKNDCSIKNIDNLLLNNKDKVYFIDFYLIKKFDGEALENLKLFKEKTIENKIFFQNEWI